MTLDEALQLADAHHRAGRFAEAEALFRQVLAAVPPHAGILHSLGTIALETGRHGEAVHLISQAIALSPSKAVYHSNLGEAYRRLERLDEAIASYQWALEFDPALAETRAFLGAAFIGAGRLDEAIASCAQAVAQKPNLTEAHNNLGIAFARQGRRDEAMAAFRRAAALAPHEAEVQANLGLALFSTGQWEEALACDRKAIQLRPDHADAHLNLGILLLLLGRYAEGWREYEWRGRVASPQNPPRGFTAPQWDGAPAPGATILVHSDQGFGDLLQFLRYVPLVRARSGAARVLLECQPELRPLLAQGDRFDAELVGKNSDLTFDLHVPILSLPLALCVFEPLTMNGSYLHADSARRAVWRERLQPGFRVGVVWAGNPRHRDDRCRSISLDQLAPLFRIENVRFYSLQIGGNPGPAPLIDLTEHIADFADTAAFMSELDLIISVDTAAAHLAGALGRSVWTLLPFVPDWRWGLGREDTPWYPTMRLFRQATAGDWECVMHRVAEELKRASP